MVGYNNNDIQGGFPPENSAFKVVIALLVHVYLLTNDSLYHITVNHEKRYSLLTFAL